MRIGIPKEVKTLEGRIALVPEAVGDLVRRGLEVLVESGAGLASGFPDTLYISQGARVVRDADALYGEAQLIVKVKEPQAEEYERLRADHLLFCYLHLAAEPELTEHLLTTGLTAIGFETVDEGGKLPLLAPMSVIAGRLAVQHGTTLLHAPNGGRGVLLGGLSGAERGHVVVFGAGNAGGQSAALAAAMGAHVTVFDLNAERLEAMHALGPNITALYPYAQAVHERIVNADLVIGAVLVPGAEAPRVLDEASIQDMSAGSVLVDIAVDQGGCFATTQATSWADPTYEVAGVTHFAVTNMPGAVPRTASQALSAALLPYVVRLAREDWQMDNALHSGINVARGRIVHPALGDIA